MNTLNGYSKSTLTDNYILTAAGGHIPLGNASGNVPLSNGTVNVNLNSDLWDGKHWDDLKIGGRNYFPINFISSHSGITKALEINGYIITTGESRVNRVYGLNFNGYSGDWTLQFEIKADTPTTAHVLICDTNADTNYGENSRINVTTEYVKHTFVFLNVNKYNVSTSYNGFIDIETDPGNTLYVKNVMLEKGTKASDWVRSIELYFRYEGSWSSSDTSKHADNAHGIVFAYPSHGVPGNWGTLVTFERTRQKAYNFQLHGTGSNTLHYRAYSADLGLKDWVEVLTSLSYTNYTVKKDGTGASGIWNIDITGGAEKVTVTNYTTDNTNYPLVWTNQNNADDVTANLLCKSYGDLYYNPANKRLHVNNLWSHNATLTLSGTSGVYIKYNNNDANSVVLSSGYFKPFGTSSGKLDLGYGNSRWKNIYATNLLNIVNTAGGADLGMVVEGSANKIGFMIGSGNVNRGIYDYTNSKWILHKDAGTTYINDWTGIGSSTKPVYFSGGKPVACTYSLNKTVPSDAVFTDTSYASYVSYKLPATEGWYRIATTAEGVYNCVGLFLLVGKGSGYHTVCTLQAGTSYNTKGATNLTILSTHHYKQKALSKVRIVYRADSWSGLYAYIEVYNAQDQAITLNVKLVDGTGWTLINTSTSGSIPSEYTSKETDLENETISSSYFKGNLDGTYINKLTGYSKATSAADITTTDTLNSALGKLEYKADTAYDWIINVTATDTDEYINKWGEIVGFLDSVKEGTDILDEFVTRKTDLTITGQKTFDDGITIKQKDFDKWSKITTYTASSSANAETHIQGNNYSHKLKLWDRYAGGCNYAELSGGYINEALLKLTEFSENSTTATTKCYTKIGTRTSRFSGKVGIGKTPYKELDIEGDISAGNSYLVNTRYRRKDGTGDSMFIGDPSAVNSSYTTGGVILAYGGPLHFYVNGSKSFTALADLSVDFEKSIKVKTTTSTNYLTSGITIGGGDTSTRYMTCYGKTGISYINFGYGTGTNNCGELAFNYTSSESVNNYVSLSLYGGNNTLYIYPSYTQSTKEVRAPKFVGNLTGDVTGSATKLGGIDAAKYVTSDFTNDPKTIGKLPYVVSGDNVLRDSNLNYFTYLIPDGGGRNTFTLIAKLTNWKVGTNSSYALIGTIYGHRAGNAARTGVHTIVAQAVSYSTLATQKLYVDNNSQFVLQPYIVLYTKTDENGNRETANYLALKKFGSGDPIHFIGYTKDLLPLNEWIDLVCPDNDGLPTDMTIVASPALNAIVLTTSQIYDGNTNRTILHSGNYTTWINTTNFPGLDKTGTVTSIKVGSTSYSPTSGVVSLPAYPTSLKSPTAIKFKNTAGTEVSYDGSTAVDLTGGINYATGATNLLIYKELSRSVYTTVKATKDQLKVEFGNVKLCVGSAINIPYQTISNWNDESFAYNSGSIYTAIKLSGGYSGNTYGLWLLSSYGDLRLYYVGLNGGEWTTLRKIAITSDIPTTLKNPHALTFATGNFTTKTYDGSTAVTVNIPTKTSHLTNDSGYLTSTSNLVTITKTISVSNEWNDTGIYLDSATFPDGAGSYVVLVSTLNHYLWTGVLSVLLSTAVTSTASNEILMHGGGFDTSQASHLYLRTIGEKESGKFKILIARHSNFTLTYTFKFKKII